MAPSSATASSAAMSPARVRQHAGDQLGDHRDLPGDQPADARRTPPAAWPMTVPLTNRALVRPRQLGALRGWQRALRRELRAPTRPPAPATTSRKAGSAGGAVRNAMPKPRRRAPARSRRRSACAVRHRAFSFVWDSHIDDSAADPSSSAPGWGLTSVIGTAPPLRFAHIGRRARVMPSAPSVSSDQMSTRSRQCTAIGPGTTSHRPRPGPRDRWKSLPIAHPAVIRRRRDSHACNLRCPILDR